jgi:hypothetical protein
LATAFGENFQARMERATSRGKSARLGEITSDRAGRVSIPRQTYRGSRLLDTPHLPATYVAQIGSLFCILGVDLNWRAHGAASCRFATRPPHVSSEGARRPGQPQSRFGRYRQSAWSL